MNNTRKKIKKRVTNCPFCDSSIVDTSFMESTDFLAIYNQSPILPGHSLIIPKYHIESLFELDENELTQFIALGQRAGKVLAKAFSTNSFNWSIQEKIPAGQTVPHLHMHIIPRVEGDLPEPGDWYPVLEKKFYSEHIDSDERIKLSPSQLKDIANKLRKTSLELLSQR